MINFTQQFNVLIVVFATKPPGLGLKLMVRFAHPPSEVVLFTWIIFFRANSRIAPFPAEANHEGKTNCIKTLLHCFLTSVSMTSFYAEVGTGTVGTITFLTSGTVTYLKAGTRTVINYGSGSELDIKFCI
jgi:hypothetical protein